MDDLVAFLKARLDEDEQTARRASEYASAEWHLDEEFGETVLWWPPEPRVAENERRLGVTVTADVWRGQTIASDGERLAPHIARHDPDRVLREVEAKRQMIDDLLAEPHEVCDDQYYTCSAATYARDGGEPEDRRLGQACNCGRDGRVEHYLRLLALPYAVHPDYKSDWAVTRERA